MSTYKGVTASKGHRHDGKWQAQIRVGQKILTWTTRFDDPQDAARVYDAMAIYLHGPDAKLNFDGRPPAEIGWMNVRLFLERPRRGLPQGALDKVRQPWIDTPQQFIKTPLL